MATCGDCVSCDDDDHETCDHCGKCLNCGAPAAPVDVPKINPDPMKRRAPVMFPSMEQYDLYAYTGHHSPMVH